MLMIFIDRPMSTIVYKQNNNKKRRMQALTDELEISPHEFLETYIEYDESGTPPQGNAVGTYMTILQKNGKAFGLKSMTDDYSIETRSELSNTGTWWRTVLNCPNSGQQYSSAVIRVRPEKQDIFGKEQMDFIFVNSEVYFKSKKMAQKSAVLQALKYLQGCAGMESTVFSNDNLECGNDMNPTTRTDKNTEKIGDYGILSDSMDSCVNSRVKRETFPSHINRMYDLGIRSYGLQIEFWTKPPSNKEEYLSQKYLSREFPTLIFCRINTLIPYKLSVLIPNPEESKSVAFGKALDLVEKEIEAVPKCDSDASNATELITLHKLYKEARIMHDVTAPPFAIRDIFNSDVEGFSELYLYDVRFGSECASIFSKSNMTTQFGMLFCVDDDAHSSDANIEVSFPFTKDRSRIGKVTLESRRKINCSHACLESLIKLNIILQDGVDYGRSKIAKQIGPDAFQKYDVFLQRAKDTMKQSLHQRTYLITPICKDAALISNIDWSNIEMILNNQIKPYQDWKDSRDHETLNGSKAFAYQSTSNQLYIISDSYKNPDITALSEFPEPSYDTFRSYYKDRFDIELMNPESPLIPAKRIVSTNQEIDEVLLLSKEAELESPSYYLIPEITMVMPLDFDLLIMHRMLSSFALPMERILSLRGLSKCFNDMCLSQTMITTDADKQLLYSSKKEQRFLMYLEEATSIGSFIAYERLEHLGDAVLGYFVALNYFACNSSMQWDDEDMGQHKLLTTRNKVLKRAALKCGIDRVIYECQSDKLWEMAFKGNVNYGSQRQPRDLCYRHLSEVVESIIGVAFLNCSDAHGPIFNDCCEKKVIEFLEELNLPFQLSLEQKRYSDERWFKAVHACIFEGFSFNNDEAWSIQYKEIISTFHCEVYIKERLLRGTQKLLSILKKLNPNNSLELSTEMEVMLACALFNDSLESDSEDSIGANPPIIFARLRENLFFIGESALHLAITMECFKRYPHASAGDLHMLKICCTSDDSIAYIALKHGIDECLYEEESECINRFKFLLSAADMYGQKLNSILPQAAYKDRWIHSWWYNESNVDIYPRYIGLGGGCLAGEKTKVGKMLTADLTYGFKSILGSLVLSVGLERMWYSVIPLFEEILMLSPDETRNYFKTNITVSYASGKNAESTLGVKRLQASFGNGWSAITL